MASLHGIGLIFFASFLWAVDTLIRYPLMGSGVSAIQVVFLEHFILLVMLLGVSYRVLKQIITVRRADLFSFMVIGGLGSCLGTLTFTQAFSYLNPSLVILLQKLQPVVAIIGARFILKESIHQAFIKWAFVCLIGSVLISYKDVSTVLQSGDLNATAIGYLLTLVAIFSWGISTVYGKKLSNRNYSNLEIMGGRFTFGFLALSVVVVAQWEMTVPKLSTVGQVSIMALLSGVIAMWAYYQGLKKISAKTCALAEMFFPFCAVIINWVFLNAKLDPIQMLGGGILVLGSAIIQLRRY